jgi:hypothetical protein
LLGSFSIEKISIKKYEKNGRNTCETTKPVKDHKKL